MSLSKVLYTAKVTVTGGREGEAASDDGHLKVKLAPPKEMGGNGIGDATNPEQLFAAGFAACFLSAMKMIAGKKKLPISDNPSIRAEVGIGPVGQAFGLQADLYVSLPGMDEKAAHELVEAAHQVCPYSNATRNNIDVNLHISTK